MCIDSSCAAAARELAARRTGLHETLDALDRGDPDADPIAVIDAALAMRAAEAAVAVAPVSAPGPRA